MAAIEPLFDRVSKCPSVLANTSVARYDRHQLWRFTKQLRRRQVHRIERAYWFDRKRPADTCKHRVGNSDHITPAFKSSQCTHRRAFFVQCQTRAGSRPKNPSCSLRNRQGGGHLAALCSHRAQCVGVTFQERGD